MEGRTYYLICGILFLLFGGLATYAGLSTDGTMPGHAYVLIAVSIMALSLSYLYPQFKRNDERTKLIRHKSMFVSYFAIIIYLIGFRLLIISEVLTLTAMQMIDLLTALIISTVFLTMVVLSKIH